MPITTITTIAQSMHTTLSVFPEDFSHYFFICQVNAVHIDFGAVAIIIRRVLGKRVTSYLRSASERGRIRIVVIVNGEDFEAPRKKEREDSMRAWVAETSVVRFLNQII